MHKISTGDLQGFGVCKFAGQGAVCSWWGPGPCRGRSQILPSAFIFRMREVSINVCWFAATARAISSRRLRAASKRSLISERLDLGLFGPVTNRLALFDEDRISAVLGHEQTASDLGLFIVGHVSVTPFMSGVGGRARLA